ncbi:hypothetical protein ACQ7NP_15975 [Pseudomonas anuradhapurensis]
MHIQPLPMAESIDLENHEKCGMLVKCLHDIGLHTTDASALPFAHETVARLDRYLAVALALPRTLEQTTKYLDYGFSPEPELHPSRMLELFIMLRLHSMGWPTLRTKCKALAGALVVQAETIRAHGIEVERLARTMRGLGDASLTWEALSQLPPVGLSKEDKLILTSMASMLEQFRLEISRFETATEAVYTGFERFRDDARLKLIPVVQEKARAVQRQSRPRSKIGYVTDHPLGVASYQDVKQLLAQIEQLDQALSTTVVSSGKMHSVWQAIGTYLESSANRLRTIDTQQRLAMFMLYFKLFMSQWEGIQRHANATLTAFR